MLHALKPQTKAAAFTVACALEQDPEPKVSAAKVAGFSDKIVRAKIET